MIQLFKRLKIAYKKIHSFLFGQEIEHIHTRKERKEYYGRIKNDHESEARMIHQYPKQGKFRFPIIDDKKQSKPINIIKKESPPTKEILLSKKEKRQVVPIQKETHKEPLEKVVFNDQPVRKKFQGVNFKAQNIPSPIYAFNKPPSKQKDNEETISIEDQKEKYISLEEIVNEEEVTSTEEVVCEEEIKSTEEIIYEEELASTEEIVYEEEITPREEVVYEEKITSAEEIIYEEEVTTIEEIDYEEHAAPVEQAYEEEIEQIDQKVYIEETYTNEDPIVEQSSPVKNTIINNGIESKTNSSKTVIPFNVLMFHKDRAAQKKLEQKARKYEFPTLQLLNIPEKKFGHSDEWYDEKKRLLEETLVNFNVQANVVAVTKGPSVTRFEIQPEAGVKVSKVTSLTDDIKLSLSAKDIRIEAPIPGRNAIGIEVPNDVSSPVFLREILRSGEFQNNPSPLTVAMGLDIGGKPIVTDIQKMPHGLIAGSTGSGKSVCINSILISIMYKATPDEVKLMLVDPKMVELAPYNNIPHLVTPVITDAKQATIALKWAVEEMERRYELFVQNGVRDIKRYNEVMKKEDDPTPAMPFIVIVIDELADLMMVSPHDVEEAICRIAQKARACGIHLLLATQRPSVDVITGLIKANIPTRIAFSVSSQVDSRTIIDSNGAERLLGKGDMLLFENGSSKPVRVQGNFVSDEEIDRVIALVKSQREPNFLFDKESLVKTYEAIDQEDDLFEEACRYVIEQGGASSSSLQRRFRIGFNRAARLIDMMEMKGIISEAMGSKPRNVLVSEDELSERM